MGAPRQAGDSDAAARADAAARDALIADLEQRIQELDGRDDADFGAFDRLDWVVLVLLAIVLPFFVLLQFAP